MKKILVPCDFSREAVEAYKFAVELAELTDLEVEVVNMIDLPTFVAGFDVQPYTYDPSLRKELSEASLKDFNNMKTIVGGSPRVKFKIVFDNVFRGVRELVEKNDFELVVMGTKGTSGVDEMLFGSNTEKVVRFSNVPVIAIRKAPKVSTIKTIVFPNDLGLDQAELVKRIQDLQSFFGAQIHLLWINTPARFVPDSEIEGMMNEFILHYGLENYRMVIKNDINEETGIRRYSREINSDMIAMATNGRRGLAHLFYGSIAEDVVNHIDCPIWTFATRSKK